MLLKLSCVFLLVFAFLADPGARAADKIDDYVRTQMRERHIPGAAIALLRDGKIIKAEGYGLASVEFNVPATKETVFEIGSITKQITAALIMLLVEEGKINLDEKIGKYLPNATEKWQNVTVRHLLTHTSGIKSYSGLPSGFELTKRLKRDDFIKAIGSYELEFEPGERWVYSNSGYNLLGFIIETVTGKSYWENARDRVFKPLGMNATGDRDPKFIIRNRATGYEWENGQLIGRDYDLTDVFSAGAIVSTVMDLAKWETALRGNTLLKEESKKQIWTPFVLNNGKPFPYGFGWNVTELRGHKILSHGGQTAGFAANISRYVDDNLTVIVFTNLGDNNLGGIISRGIAKIYIPGLSLRAMTAKPGADKNISDLFERALNGRLENKLDANLFTAELYKALMTERARSAAMRVAGFGKPRSFVFVGEESADKRRVFRFKADTGTRLFLWRFGVDEAGKIAEMVLEEEE